MGLQLHTAVVGKLEGHVGELATLEQLSEELGAGVCCTDRHRLGFALRVILKWLVI
jgi:hypothetical protein